MSKFPILYKGDATDFFKLGLGPVQMLKATVTQERNGIFIFEGEILTDSPLFPLVLENYIIKADADHLLKDQRFRIKRIVPNHNGKAEIYAEHVSYLSRELTIKPEVNITGSAQVALNQWKASIVESNPFIVSSDITTNASTKWRIDKVSNPMMALGGVEGSILNRWGGEYLFDNYHIRLLKKRGTTAQTVLAYGRNITDFEQERNILSTYTSVAPYAIYTDDNEKEIVVTVDGFVVDSEHVNKFPNRVTKPIDFSSEFGSDEIPTKARLTTLAQQYIADNEIGVPTTSIKISFLDLSQTADYADYAFLEQVNLCDDVRVHYPKLGVNTIAKVVRVVWNCLTESYDEIEIGQKRMSLASQIQEQNKVIQEINTQTNYAMTSADGKNTIFHGLYGENGLGEPTATKVGDTWFKPNGTGTDILTWTGTVWQLVFDAKTFDDIGVKVDEMEQEVQNAVDQSNTAINNASQAIADAGFAKNQSATALSQAGQAVADANSAIANAQSALDAYRNMEIGGRNFLRGSSSEWQDYNFVGWNFNSQTYELSDLGLSVGDILYISGEYEALTGSPVSMDIALFGQTTNYRGGGRIEVGSSGISTWVGGIPDGTTSIRISHVQKMDGETRSTGRYRLTGVYKSTVPIDWTPAPEDVQVKITDINGELSRKVSQQTFDTLQGTVNTQSTQINQNKADILLRATKTEVDTLTGTVNSLDSQLKLEAGKITALNSKTDGHTTQIGSLESSFSGLNSTVATVKRDLDGLEIGARNLLLRSTETVGYWIDSAGNVASNNRTSVSDYIAITPLSDYMFTKTSSTISDPTVGGYFRFAWYTEDKTYIARMSNSKNEFKWTAPSNAYYIRISYPDDSQVKFEKGNKATDWTPAPEDMATVTQFSSLEQTVNGIQTKVANKAEQSEVTQLAGQWSTTVAKVDGHTGQITNLGEQINLRLTKAQVAAEILKDNQVLDTRNTNEPPSWYYANYPKQTVRELKTNTAIGLSGVGTYSTVTTDVGWSDSSGGNVEQTAKADNGVYQRRGNGDSWSAWSKVADTSNVISQINLSSEGVLIQGKNIWLDGNTKINDAVIKTAHIADLAVSGAKIANASIASAKIINLDASKIVANDLSAITTNTGQLNVTGWLDFSTENRALRGNYDFGDAYGGAYDARWFDGSFRLSHRHFVFTGDNYEVTPSNTKGTHLGYAESYQGQDYLKFRTWNYNGINNTMLGRVDITSTYINMSNRYDTTNINFDSTNGNGYFRGLLSVNDVTVGTSGNLQVYDVNAHSSASNIYFNSRRGDVADFRIGLDGVGRVVQSLAVYNRTYSGASNMFITENGTFGRSISARKYKADIQAEYLTKSKKVLQINPSSWYDKVELANGKATKRHYGFIANEFHELGLTEVVQYGADGQVEGLAYDRISMYHNVILADHEQQLSTVTQQLTTVANSRLQHSLLLESKLLSLEETVVQLKQEIEQLRTA